MRRVSRLLLTALAFLPIDAFADYDVSGRWGVSESSGFHYHWDIVQSGSDLEVSYVGEPDPFMTGTIDLGTGAMTFDPALPPFACGSNTLTGTASPDGNSFTLTHTSHVIHPAPAPLIRCWEEVAILTGSRCGNALLDPGEACDDGNDRDGDCCSSSCGFETAGSACPTDLDACTDDVCDASGTCTHPFSSAGTSCDSDFDVCTDDTCDGAGVCTHPANAAPCEEEFGCGAGTCSGGNCVLSTFEPAGTSCDLDSSVCTTDTCDGAGSCAAGAAVDCAPCGNCDAQDGCVLDTGNCFVGGNAFLQMTIGERARLKVYYGPASGISSISAGDPLTNTTYTLCLGQVATGSSVSKLMYGATVAPGGTCNDKPCWRSRSGQYLYKDRLGSSGGISRLKLRATEGENTLYSTEWQGKGANLGLPDELVSDLEKLTAMLIVDDGSSPVCEYRSVRPLTWSGSGTKVKGSSPFVE